MTADEQRIAALARANEVRLRNVAVKRQIASLSTTAGREQAARLLTDGGAETLTVEALLLSVRRLGPERCRQILRRLNVSGGRRIGRLTDRERMRLAAALRAGR